MKASKKMNESDVDITENMAFQHNTSCQMISVIIPTKNEGGVLGQCLDSIFSQHVNPIEVIVVDGGSTDNTLDIAKKYDVRIIKEGRFSSPANARNLGAEYAKGDVLLIMDADIILHQDCLKNALRFFKDERIAALLPSDVGHDHSYLEYIQRKWNEGSRTSFSIGFQPAKARTSGLIVFFKKVVFDKIRFDVKYGFGEDDHLSTELEQEFKACGILHAESCKVISHSPHTIRELASRYMWWGRTFPAYFADHANPKTLLNLCGLLMSILVVSVAWVSIALPPARTLFMPILLVFIARISTVCLRSRSVLFFQFAFFDLARSFFFLAGLVQSLFVSKKGR